MLVLGGMDDDASEKRRTLQRVCSRSTRCPHSRSAPSSKCQHAFARESCLQFLLYFLRERGQARRFLALTLRFLFFCSEFHEHSALLEVVNIFRISPHGHRRNFPLRVIGRKKFGSGTTRSRGTGSSSSRATSTPKAPPLPRTRRPRRRRRARRRRRPRRRRPRGRRPRRTRRTRHR